MLKLNGKKVRSLWLRLVLILFSVAFLMVLIIALAVIGVLLIPAIVVFILAIFVIVLLALLLAGAVNLYFTILRKKA